MTAAQLTPTPVLVQRLADLDRQAAAVDAHRERVRRVLASRGVNVTPRTTAAPTPAPATAPTSPPPPPRRRAPVKRRDPITTTPHDLCMHLTPPARTTPSRRDPNSRKGPEAPLPVDPELGRLAELTRLSADLLYDEDAATICARHDALLAADREWLAALRDRRSTAKRKRSPRHARNVA